MITDPSQYRRRILDARKELDWLKLAFGGFIVGIWVMSFVAGSQPHDYMQWFCGAATVVVIGAYFLRRRALRTRIDQDWREYTDQFQYNSEEWQAASKARSEIDQETRGIL